MSNPEFDVRKFWEALDATRQSRNMTWKSVANKTGVAASTLTRIGQGKRPDVDGLAALLNWLGLEMSDFYSHINAEQNNPEALTQVTALLRADSSLSRESSSMLVEMVKAAYASQRDEKD